MIPAIPPRPALSPRVALLVVAAFLTVGLALATYQECTTPVVRCTWAGLGQECTNLEPGYCQDAFTSLLWVGVVAPLGVAVAWVLLRGMAGKWPWDDARRLRERREGR